jgi:AcrR family transcriptional regulator
MDAGPKWRRRKADRPTEIVEAALIEFAKGGFANTKLDDIAARAGISKAALYRYFGSKEDVFRAVAETAIAQHLEGLAIALAASDAPFEQTVSTLLAGIARSVSDSSLPAVIRLVIGESRSFPELASIWHDMVVSRALGAFSALIGRAQDRGELVAGDARLMAVSLVGPLLMGVLLREVFGEPIDLEALANQHARTMLHGAVSAPSDQRQGE